MNFTFALFLIELCLGDNTYGFSVFNIKNWDTENNRALLSLYYCDTEIGFDFCWFNILKL